MPYAVEYAVRVIEKHIPAIPAANRGQIARAINERLTADPVGLGKPLTGKFKGLSRLRVGDWRVIYEVIGGRVVIHAIGMRKDIYK